MKRPILERLVPESSGFNRRRIAVAGTVLFVALGAITFLLTRTSEEPILRPEAQVTPAATRPPRELLEDPPETKPVPEVFRPDLGTLMAPEPESLAQVEAKPQISPRVIKAFDAIDYAPRHSASPGLERRRSSNLPPELTAIFDDLEAQNQALAGMLETTTTGLPRTSLGSLAGLLPQEPSDPVHREPPATHHQQLVPEPAGDPLVLRQGTVIPAQLLTEINSDLPGQVTAHVVSDVLDSLYFRTVLVPRGTKLIGWYRSGLGHGQNRLAVVWTRLLFPDGRTVDVGELPAVDSAGRSGLRDRVDHHVARVFGDALLLSLLSAGFEAAQQASSDRLSPGDFAVDGASRELERAASEILRRSASIPPTVRIRAGTAFSVLLTGDLAFSKP